MIHQNRISPSPKIIIYSLTALILLVSLSCSGGGSSPTAPPPDLPENYSLDLSTINPGSTHKMMGMSLATFDPDTGDVDIVPLRTSEAHMNLSSFLNHPACPNSSCLTWYVKGYDPLNRVWILDMHLINPTVFNAYDVRLQFMDMPGDRWNPDDPSADTWVSSEWEIVNPDSYTNIWDTDNPFTPFVQWMNPFIAFEKEDFDRKFLADPDGTGKLIYSDIEELKVHIPQGAPGGVIVLVLDVSWPGHCYDPYQIVTMKQLEPLQSGPEDPAKTSNVEVVVADWQQDVLEVSLYMPDIITDEFAEMDIVPNVGPNKWPPDLDFSDGLSQEELDFLTEYGSYVDMSQSPPDTSNLRKWEIELTNEEAYTDPDNKYPSFVPAIIVAMSIDLDFDGNDTLYNTFEFEVEKSGSGGPGGTTGSQIVFSRYEMVGDTMNAEIWSYVFKNEGFDGDFYKIVEGAIVGGVGSDEMEVTVDDAGERIAFVSNYHKNNTLGTFVLYEAPIQYAAPNVPMTIQITDPQVEARSNLSYNARTPDYSPDGDHVAYASDENITWDIFRWDRNIPGAANKLTVNFASEEAPNYDKKYPNGGGLYFQSNRAGANNYEIYWMDPQQPESSGNPVTRITFDNGFDGYPSSSYVGQTLTWTSDRFGNPEIMIFNGIDTVTRLTIDDAIDTFPSFSRDGNWIAFMTDRNDFQFDIYIMTDEGGSLRRVTNEALPELDPFYGKTKAN